MRRKSLKKFLVLLLTTSMVGTMYVPAMATEVRPSDTTVESTDEQNVTDDQGTAENDQENQVSVQSDEATGTEENTGAGVAQIGEKTYATLQEAVNAAEAGATIQLLADVTEDVTITEEKDLTLDLNGKTLKNTDAGKATVLVKANAQVTVKNGTVLGGASYYNIRLEKTGTAVLEDVVATAGNNGSSMIDNWGTLTIESGTYTGGLDVVKNEPTGDITINDGFFEKTSISSKGFTAVIYTYGKLIINDGTFKQSAKSKFNQEQTIFVDVDSSEPSNPVTCINGGNFTNDGTKKTTAWNVRASNAATKAGTFAIVGGTFNRKNGLDSYLADDYTSVYSAGKYMVKKAVAQIGTTKYVDLATALAKGDNVKLLSDITTDATKTAAVDRLYIKKDCTLDLNGHSITFPYELEPTENFVGFFVNGATMTVKDTSEEQTGKIQTGDQDNMGVYLFNVIGGGTLILESGNYFGGGTVAQAQKGNVYVKGGNYAVKAFQTPFDSQFLLNCYDPAYKNGTATITVTGGTFKNFDPANCTAESTGTSFVAAGYESIENDGIYTVVKKSDAEESLTADTKVTGTASNATIGGNYTGKEKDIETKDGNVTINISNGDKNVIASNIFVSNESIKSLDNNSSVENVTIKSDVADMTIDKEALTAINTAAAGEDVMFKIEKESTDEQLLYHVTAVAGGKDVYTASTSATNGNVSISVPYALNTEGMTPIVYYVPASGVKQVVKSTYVGGTLTWKTSHFSTFEIGEALAAENSVAQITATDGTITRYATLQNAVDAVEKGQTVTLLSNTTESITISEGQTVTLDLNGYTLTNEDKEYTITNKGTLTIEDSSAAETGTVDNISHGRSAIYNEVGATATLNGGTYTRSKENGGSKEENGGNSYYTLLNRGTMTINDGVNVNQGAEGNSKYSSLVENGWYNGNQNTTKASSKMYINGGTFNGGLNVVKNDDYGVLEITNGNFKNSAQNCVFNVNVATISGGTFVSEQDSTVYSRYYDGGMNAGKLTITGGTFTPAKGTYAVYGYDDQVTTTITGGTFKVANSAAVVNTALTEGSYVPVKDEQGNVTVEKDETVTVEFLGGSLRKDFEDFTQTSMRFGYKITVPEGVKASWYWNYGTNKTNLKGMVEGTSKKVLGDNQYASNLVVTEIPSRNYGTTIYSQLHVTYEKDGKTYSYIVPIEERSVERVAKAIIDDTENEKPENREYAQKLLDAMK